MGLISRARGLWKRIFGKPEMPERDAFHDETERRQDTTRSVRPAQPAPMAQPSPAARVRGVGIVMLCVVLALTGCATLIGAVDSVSDAIETIEMDFAPYIAMLPPDVQAALLIKWAEVKAAIAAASAVLDPLR